MKKLIPKYQNAFGRLPTGRGYTDPKSTWFSRGGTKILDEVYNRLKSYYDNEEYDEFNKYLNQINNLQETYSLAHNYYDQKVKNNPKLFKGTGGIEGFEGTEAYQKYINENYPYVINSLSDENYTRSKNPQYQYDSQHTDDLYSGKTNDATILGFGNPDGDSDFLKYQNKFKELGLNYVMSDTGNTFFLKKLDSEKPKYNTPPSSQSSSTKYNFNYITRFDTESESNTPLIDLSNSSGSSNSGSHVNGVPGSGGGNGGGSSSGDNSEDNNNKNTSANGNGKFILNPTWFDAFRLGLDNIFNIKNTENLIDNLSPVLQNYTPSYRQVHGDYVSQQQARRRASELINRRPISSNAQIEHAAWLDSVNKGNRLTEQGDAIDSQTYWRTAEQAFQQAKENNLGYQNVANANYKAITDLNNQIAQLRYEMNRANQQNVDQLGADISGRMWADYDYYKYKQRYDQEALDELNDSSYGVGGDQLLLSDLNKRYQEVVRDNPNDAEKLRKQMDVLQGKITAQRTLNKLRRLDPTNGIERWQEIYGGRYVINSSGQIVGVTSRHKDELSGLGVDVDAILKTLGLDSSTADTVTTSGSHVRTTTEDFKNGGLLRFLQSGGFVKYSSPTGFQRNPYSSASEKKTSSKSSDSQSSDEKTKEKLLNNIAETLKGVDGLNSDVSILSEELLKFFDYTKYSIDDDPTQFYTMYVKALTRVNQVKQSGKLFGKAYEKLETSGALSSPAVTSFGQVIVGIDGTNNIKAVKPQEYLDNTDKYHLITNGELLELRRSQASMAFNDKYLTTAAQSGTSMEAIEKYIKDFISGLGKDEQSSDILTRQFGNNIEGIQTLQRIVQGKLTDKETAEIALALNSLGEYNVSTSSQITQISAALNSIFAFMPDNMKALLTIYSGGEQNAEKAVLGLITKGTGTTSNFTIKGFTGLDEKGQIKSGSTKSGSGSGGSSDEPLKDQTLVSIVRGIGGTSDRIKINEGTKSEMSIDVKNYQINGAYEPMSLMDALSKTNIMGMSDSRKIYFGDQVISSQNLGDIAYLGQGFSRAMLPIKSDGSPDFTILSRFESVCDNLRSKGININTALGPDGKDQDKAEVAKALQGEGLFGLVDRNGLPNISRFGLFLLTEGLSSSKAGIKQSKYVVQNDDQSDRLQSILTITNGNTGKTIKEYELDKYSVFNPFDWGGNYSKIFEGTIYIPINPNELQADIASGNKAKDSYAQSLEQEWQSANMRNNFKDRE